MFETLWPRLRTLGRLSVFVAGLVVIAAASLSALGAPVLDEGLVAAEMALIAAACLVMLLATKI